MKVKFSRKELNFLINTLPQEEIPFKFIINAEKSIELELNDDLANKIRDWASEKQQIIGYDKDYELTEDGKILDSIIDKLYH
jgi:hypothetical protein